MSVRSWRVDDEITKLHSTPTRRRTRRASTRFARTTAGTSPVGCETTRRQCQAAFCSEPTFDVKVKSNPQMCPLSPSGVRKMPLYVLIINDVISLVYYNFAYSHNICAHYFYRVARCLKVYSLTICV